MSTTALEHMGHRYLGREGTTLVNKNRHVHFSQTQFHLEIRRVNKQKEPEAKQCPMSA